MIRVIEIQHYRYCCDYLPKYGVDNSNAEASTENEFKAIFKEDE